MLVKLWRNTRHRRLRDGSPKLFPQVSWFLLFPNNVIYFSSVSVQVDVLCFYEQRPSKPDQGDRNPRVTKLVNVEPELPVRNTQTEFNPTLTIGKVELAVEQNNDGSISTSISKGGYHPFQGYISNVMKNFETSDTDGSDADDSEDANEQLGFDSENELSGTDRLSPTLSSNINKLSIEDAISDDDESDDNGDDIDFADAQLAGVPKEPKFGFCEDDFTINTAELTVSNIRLGATSDSYYMKSYRCFGDYDFRWVDHDIISDFILEMGLPENRLNAYLDYIKEPLLLKDEPEPTFSDIYISETEDEFDGEESEYSDIDEGLREGLDDLISYTLKYNATRNQAYETKGLVTSGRGKNKKLRFDDSLDLDADTKAMLQGKLDSRQRAKSNKKQSKEDYISQENKNSDDLFKKYPYGLHVQNIRDEFEIFLTKNKPTMAFPPFDPHGNKTIAKFAQHYSMKGNKVGKGGKTHIMVEKVKRTKWSKPDYNMIGQLLKQRRVFMRIDVRKPMEERELSERRSGKGKFHIQEGEIVGEDAPEIGKDNIGRRILEKLGWNSGQGLGAHGNEGISEPVMAKVKKNKSGLRHSKE